MRRRRKLAAAAASGCLVAATIAGSVGAQAATGITVTWKVDSSWSTGQTVSATITNNSTSAVKNWAVLLAMPSNSVTSGWNATWTAKPTGVQVSAPSWAPDLAAGASVSVGASTTANASPASCTSSIACSVIVNGSPSPTPTTSQTPTGSPSASPSSSPSTSSTPTASSSPTPTATSSTTPGPSGLPTPTSFTPRSTASGVLSYHLNLPYGSGNVETLNLSSNYTDLIISNYTAGALLGRMLKEKEPKLTVSRDYLYGSLFGQLLQENINTGGYSHSSDWINPDAVARNSLLASGQGGPYQLNDYSKRLETNEGVGLVNFVALQKGLGYTVEAQDSGAQTASKGPDGLDQKYFGPMAAAYFHLNDYNRMQMNNSQSWGPQYAYYSKCMTNLQNVSGPNGNIYDMLLNAAYNAGTYSTILKDYMRICAGMTTAGSPEATQVASMGDYSLSDTAYQKAIGTTEAAGSTFILYPRQIRIYLDQLYNQKTFNSAAITGNTSLRLAASDIAAVFANAVGTLAYVDSSGTYRFIPNATAAAAINSALSASGVGADAFLDISNAAARNTFFNVLDAALANVSQSLGMTFSAITQQTIGAAPTASPSPTTSGTATPTPSPTSGCVGATQKYPAGRGSYAGGTCVEGADHVVYRCISNVVAPWCNSPAEWAYAPGTGSAWDQAWSR